MKQTKLHRDMGDKKNIDYSDEYLLENGFILSNSINILNERNKSSNNNKLIHRQL